MALIVLLMLVASTAYGQPQQSCAPCHNEQITDFQTHKHAKAGLQCGICHGPSEKHRASTGNVPPDRIASPEEVPALCGNCHAQEKNQYLRSAHGIALTNQKKGKTVNCNTCHGVHAVKAWAANEQACLRCHEARPAACKAQPVVANTRVSCTGCHAWHTLALAGR